MGLPEYNRATIEEQTTGILLNVNNALRSLSRLGEYPALPLPEKSFAVEESIRAMERAVDAAGTRLRKQFGIVHQPTLFTG